MLHAFKGIFRRQIKQMYFKNSNFMSSLDADIIIFPSTGAEVEIFEMIALAKIYNKKSVLVIENWDNLTSKSIFPVKPDFITVMGRKSCIQANEIHGFALERIISTGLPKFEKLINENNIAKRVPNVSGRINFLYLGYSLPYNENSQVEKIYHYLLNKVGKDEFDLTYRPHPMSQKRYFEKNFTVSTSKEIKIDQVKIQNNDRTALPSIDQTYVNNLESYDFIISTPTTMALEIMLLGIPCVIDGNDDGIHITAPFHTLQNYLHQEDLLEIPELRISKTTEELFASISEYLYQKPVFVKYSLDEIVETRDKFSNNLIRFLKD